MGVSPSAADEEIKKAYRELARKYHPDKYINNPLADLAQEKMKEINEAYDTIIKSRSGGTGGTYDNGQTYGPSGYSSGYGSGSNATYTQIRREINNGNIAAAEAMLNQINNRTAEWYYIRGHIDLKRGWYDQAKRNFETACSMEPQNPEYRQALNYMNSNQTGYYNGQQVYRSDCDACDICSSLMCANCLCSLCGGRSC